MLGRIWLLLVGVLHVHSAKDHRHCSRVVIWKRYNDNRLFAQSCPFFECWAEHRLEDRRGEVMIAASTRMRLARVSVWKLRQRILEVYITYVSFPFAVQTMITSPWMKIKIFNLGDRESTFQQKIDAGIVKDVLSVVSGRQITNGVIAVSGRMIPSAIRRACVVHFGL